MQVSGTLLDYLFFVEGVKVPVSAIQVSVTSNSGARLSVSMPALPESMNFVRGMKVLLFKKENTSEPILKFFGLVQSKAFSKRMGTREFTLICASVDCRWATMLCATLSTSTLKSTSCTEAVTSSAVKTKSTGTSTSTSASTSGNVVVSESSTTGETTGTPEKVQVPRAKVLSYLSYNVRFLAKQTPLVMMPSVGSWKFDSEASNGKSESTPTVKDVQLASMIESIFCGRDALGNGNEVNISPLKAIVRLITALYAFTDEYLYKEFSDMHVSEMLYDMDIFDADSFSLSVIDKSEGKDVTLGKALGKTLSKLATEHPSGLPVYSLIHSLIDTIFCRVSIDPTRLDKSIVFHPEMIGFIPPRCNVIFPNRYDGLTLNYNNWSEPTRSIIGFGINRGDPLLWATFDKTADKELNSSAVLSNSRDPFLSQVTEIFGREAENKEDTKSTVYKAMQTLTDEEALCGVTPNVQNINFDSLNNMSIEEKRNLADFLHFSAKYSNRSCTVSCVLPDDYVVGMPVILLDDVYSIHGILESYSYSITPDGQTMGEVTISSPKMFFNGMDAVPPLPSWINSSKGKADKIGAVYKEMLGCLSIYPEDSQEGLKEAELNLESDSPTVTMAKLTAYLVNAFNKASDKAAFVEKYRQRDVTTMSDLMKTAFKCTPEYYTNNTSAVRKWVSGEGSNIFASYEHIGDALPARGVQGLAHAPICKATLVEEYMNTYHRFALPGATGGLLANEERSLDNPLKVSVKQVEYGSNPQKSSASVVPASATNSKSTSASVDASGGSAWVNKSRSGSLNLILTRIFYGSTRTLGTLDIGSFRMHTLELPWLNNRRAMSCIPTGTYTISRRCTPHYGKHFLLNGVKDRDMILVHVGNNPSNTEGCILVGMSSSFNGDNGALQRSREAMVKLIELTDSYKDLTITISDKEAQISPRQYLI